MSGPDPAIHLSDEHSRGFAWPAIVYGKLRLCCIVLVRPSTHILEPTALQHS